MSVATRGLAAFTPAEVWGEAKKAILLTLREDVDLQITVRGGVPFPLGSEVAEASFGEYEDGEGRRLQSYRQQYVSRMQIILFNEMLRTAMPDKSGLGAQDVILGEHDCLSIAPLNSSKLQRLKAALEKVSPKIMFFEYDATNELHLLFFWRRLVDTGLVDHGKVFVPYEDGADQLVIVDGRLEFVVPEGHPRDSSYDGFFSAGVGEIIFETGLKSPNAPPPLTSGRLSREVGLLLSSQAPAVRVADQLVGSRTLRISKMDDPTAAAIAATPAPGHRFPDLHQVVAKLQGYCLSPEYDKSIGFLEHGYGSSNEDAIRLAGLLCSALMNDFPVLEARPNSDGSVQYTVPIAVRAPRGSTMFLTTSWIHSKDSSPRLSTGFIASSRAYSAWGFPQSLSVGWNERLSNDFVQLAIAASEYSKGFAADAGVGCIGLGVPFTSDRLKEWQLLSGLAGEEGVILNELMFGFEGDDFVVIGDLSRVEAFCAHLQASLARVGLLVEFR